MQAYRQNLLLHATPSAVYAALTTPEGLRSWWTQDCDADTEAGGTIRLRFGRTHKEMRIVRLEPGREVRWLCVGAHIAATRLTRKDEWVGTQIVFRLAAQDDTHTRLEFEHTGLLPSLECYDICCDGWRHFLASLQAHVETGHGTPHVPQGLATAQ